ncbi:MAG: hypothetical protein E3J72_07945 [Planctomycetota bacterium]|nr:MAG: hypothetical protein E3J72_07945 [Planctomycetota bacterium]
MSNSLILCNGMGWFFFGWYFLIVLFSELIVILLPVFVLGTVISVFLSLKWLKRFYEFRTRPGAFGLGVCAFLTIISAAFPCGFFYKTLEPAWLIALSVFSSIVITGLAHLVTITLLVDETQDLDVLKMYAIISVPVLLNLVLLVVIPIITVMIVIDNWVEWVEDLSPAFI